MQGMRSKHRDRPNFWTETRNWINFPSMKRTQSIVALVTFGLFLGSLAALPVSGQDSDSKPVGQLILFADTAVFSDPSNPNNCTLKNRFKHGDYVGFRLYAVD